MAAPLARRWAGRRQRELPAAPRRRSAPVAGARNHARRTAKLPGAEPTVRPAGAPRDLPDTRTGQPAPVVRAPSVRPSRVSPARSVRAFRARVGSACGRPASGGYRKARARLQGPDGDGPPESAGSRLRAARPVSRLKSEAKGLRRSHPASQIPPLTAAERYHHAHPRGRATHSIRHDQTDLPAAAHPHPGRHDHTPPHATPHPTRAGTTDPTPRGPAPVQAGTTPRPPASPRPAPLRDRSRLAQGGNAAGLSSGRKRPPPVTDG